MVLGNETDVSLMPGLFTKRQHLPWLVSRWRQLTDCNQGHSGLISVMSLSHGLIRMISCPVLLLTHIYIYIYNNKAAWRHQHQRPTEKNTVCRHFLLYHMHVWIVKVSFALFNYSDGVACQNYSAKQRLGNISVHLSHCNLYFLFFCSMN